MKTKVDEAEQAEEITADEQTAAEEETPKKRKVVIPGEVIISGEDYLPGDGARREGNDLVASRFGLAEQAGRIVKVISITGAFIPRRNNIVIGRVTDITFRGWLIDVDSASSGFLSLEDVPRYINKNEMDQFLAIGDVVVAKIFSISARGIDLTLKSRGLGKLEGGFIFRVSPNRVPRVIGREGSMISLIKDKTGCNITVGQNGWVWVNGENTDKELKARRAVEFVTEKVHIEGLTEKMEAWFEKN